jgi:hypothetical protein
MHIGLFYLFTSEPIASRFSGKTWAKLANDLINIDKYEMASLIIKNEKLLLKIPIPKLLDFAKNAIEHVHENSAIYVAQILLAIIQEPVYFFNTGNDWVSLFWGLSTSIVSNRDILNHLSTLKITNVLHKFIEYFNENPLNYGIDFLLITTRDPLNKFISISGWEKLLPWIESFLSNEVLYKKILGNGQLDLVLHQIAESLISNPSIITPNLAPVVEKLLPMMINTDATQIVALVPLALNIGNELYKQANEKWDHIVFKSKSNPITIKKSHTASEIESSFEKSSYPLTDMIDVSEISSESNSLHSGENYIRKNSAHSLFPAMKRISSAGKISGASPPRNLILTF